MNLFTAFDARYRVEGLLARGSRFDVYLAIDDRLERSVALKVLRSAAVGDLERGQREVNVLANLRHPNVVRLLDLGVLEGQSFLVLEYVEGQDLARVLDRGPLTPGRAGAVGAGVSAALAHLHSNGVVHLDIKPSNILVGADGRVRLSDFGSVQLEGAPDDDTRVVSGNPAYGAPELREGGHASPAADIYALGRVLSESLAGGPTLESGSGDGEWQTLLTGMTAPEPQNRPTAADVQPRLAELAEVPDLASTTAPLPVIPVAPGATPSPASPSLASRVRELLATPRTRWIGGAALGLLVIAVLALLLSGHGHQVTASSRSAAAPPARLPAPTTSDAPSTSIPPTTSIPSVPATPPPGPAAAAADPMTQMCDQLRAERTVLVARSGQAHGHDKRALSTQLQALDEQIQRVCQ